MHTQIIQAIKLKELDKLKGLLLENADRRMIVEYAIQLKHPEIVVWLMQQAGSATSALHQFAICELAKG